MLSDGDLCNMMRDRAGPEEKRITYMAMEARVSVELLPALGIVDGVVVVDRVRWGRAKALVHARNLAKF